MAGVRHNHKPIIDYSPMTNAKWLRGCLLGRCPPFPYDAATPHNTKLYKVWRAIERGGLTRPDPDALIHAAEFMELAFAHKQNIAREKLQTLTPEEIVRVAEAIEVLTLTLNHYKLRKRLKMLPYKTIGGGRSALKRAKQIPWVMKLVEAFKIRQLSPLAVSFLLGVQPKAADRLIRNIILPLLSAELILDGKKADTEREDSAKVESGVPEDGNANGKTRVPHGNADNNADSIATRIARIIDEIRELEERLHALKEELRMLRDEFTYNANNTCKV